MEVVRFEFHDGFRIHAVRMGRPVGIARVRTPALVTAVGGPGMLRAVTAAGPVRERHLADPVQQIAMVDDPVADDVDDLALLLHPALHADHRGGHDGAALPLEPIRP